MTITRDEIEAFRQAILATGTTRKPRFDSRKYQLQVPKLSGMHFLASKKSVKQAKQAKQHKKATRLTFGGVSMTVTKKRHALNHALTHALHTRFHPLRSMTKPVFRPPTWPIPQFRRRDFVRRAFSTPHSWSLVGLLAICAGGGGMFYFEKERQRKRAQNLAEAEAEAKAELAQAASARTPVTNLVLTAVGAVFIYTLSMAAYKC